MWCVYGTVVSGLPAANTTWVCSVCTFSSVIFILTPSGHNEVVRQGDSQYLELFTMWNTWNTWWWVYWLSPSFRISEDHSTWVCTVEFEIVILRPEQDILEFERSRCFIAGRYYQICVISVLIQVQWSYMSCLSHLSCHVLGWPH